MLPGDLLYGYQLCPSLGPETCGIRESNEWMNPWLDNAVLGPSLRIKCFIREEPAIDECRVRFGYYDGVL